MAFTSPCGHPHETVAEARQCWQGTNAEHIELPAREERPVRQSPKADSPGIYLVDETYYKVQFNQDKTRVYAKRGEMDGSGKWCWIYDKGAIYNIRQSHIITAEQASEFGKVHDCCINCSKDLSREESLRRGYGPKCAENHGWPYDHSAN